MQKLEMKASGLPAQNLCQLLGSQNHSPATVRATATVAQIMLLLLLLPELRQSQLTQSVEEEALAHLLGINAWLKEVQLKHHTDN